MQRHHVVAKPAHAQGYDTQEDHDGPVHGAELVVELGQHNPAGHGGVAEQPPISGIGLARVGQLPAHQHHQREAEEQKYQRRHHVLDADDLVVGREDELPPERKFLVMVL